MSWFDFIPSIWRKKYNQALYQYEIHSGQVNSIPDDPTAYIEQGYAGNTSVYSVINRIDNMRKQATLKLYKDVNGKPEEITENHELLKFLDKVNQTTYTTDFITEHLTYILTIGEFFVYTPRISTGIDIGKVPELNALPSSEVEIIEGTAFNPVQRYRVEGNYNTFFEANEVYHAKLFNPLAKNKRTLHGLSPLHAAAKTVSKLNQIEATQLMQYSNQGAPYILFKKTTTNNPIDINQNRLTDTQRAEIINAIKNSGSEKTRGLPLVLKDEMGKLDLGQKLADLEIIESSRDGIRALCNVYCFPVDLMNDPSGSTYNNKSTARKSAWTDCIIPNLCRVEQTLNACLVDEIPAYKGLYFKFDYSEVEELQEGMETKVGWMRAARWTGDEIREATGKTVTDDEMMKQPIIPMGDGFLSDFSGDDIEPNFSDYAKPKT